MPPVARRGATLLAYLEGKALRTPTGCLEWPSSGCDPKSRYGKTSSAGKAWYVHRLAEETRNGPLLPGEVVRHSCDNPPCFADEHLLRGSQVDNMADCIQRGRKRPNPRKGADHQFAKLTEAQVLYIRRSPLSTRKLAAMLGVGKTIVHRIKAGQNWAHLKETE